MANRVPLTDAQVALLAPVQTVAGRTGAVVLSATDIPDLDAYSIDRLVTGEPVMGLINGSNATFTTPDSFIPETVDMTVNGLLQRRGIDFTTSGTTTILMSESPLTGDHLTTTYRKA